MIWVILDRVVHLMTFMLLVLMISVIFNNNKTSQEVGNFTVKIDGLHSQTMKALSSNIEYFDSRINRLAENQDSYQVGIDQRVTVLESQMKSMQADKKNNQRIVNTNINNSNAVVNER